MERVNEIINLLLSHNDYLTTNDIAEKMKVSNKTIRNEFYKIEELLKKYNLSLDRKPGSGVLIIGDEIDIIRLKEVVKHIKNVVPFSSEERKNYILNRLFKDNTNLIIRQLATELYVSKSTIHKDLLSVEQWLHDFNLRLIKKPNLGIEIEGEEQDWRAAFISLLSTSDQVENKEIVENNPTNISSRLDQNILDKLNSIIQLNYYMIERVLSEAEKELKYDFSDEAFINLMIHIALSIKRIGTNGNSGITENHIKPLMDKMEYRAARNIIKKINNYFDVTLPDYEIYYITVHILGSKRYSYLNKETFEESNESLAYIIANEIIDIIEGYLGICLKDDKQFKNALIIHLNPTLNRIKYGLTLRNPITDEIEENYPEAYGIAWLSNTIFKKYFGKVISREEVGYLALHIEVALERNRKPLKALVVCSSGIGTSQLLALRLKKHFSDLQVVDVISTLSLKKVNLEEVDLIISTVGTGVKIPEVIISPLFSERDIRKLEITINYLKVKVSNGERNSIIDEEFIELRGEYSDREQIIKNMCKKLEEKKYVSHGFEESVLMRENKYTTEVGNGVAIPHGSLEYVNVPIMMYIKLKEPIKWKDEFVDKVLLFCAREQDISKFIKFFRNFYKLLESDEEIRRLESFNNKLDLRNYLEDIFYDN